MAKKLTTQAKIVRLHNQGFSDSQIANVTGFSKSSVGRIRRGQQSGEKIAPAVNEFFKLGKRARQNVASGALPLPSAKPATAIKMRPKVIERIVSSYERAAGQLSQYRAGEKVVVQFTSKQTGKSRTLFAHGGIEAGDLKSGQPFGGGGFGAAVAAQMDSQYGDDDVDYSDYDTWDDYTVDVEEY